LPSVTAPEEEALTSLFRQMLADLHSFSSTKSSTRIAPPEPPLRRSPAPKAAHVHLFELERSDAGPTNNCIPEAASGAGSSRRLLVGAMKGRTMYVVPYLMGPVGLPVEVGAGNQWTALCRREHADIMTRMGKVALGRPWLARGKGAKSPPTTAKGLHSLGVIQFRSPLHLAISRARSRSGASVRAMAATPCFARSVASVNLPSLCAPWKAR
jgi:hypothetical protein